jgi:hypothetical protein
MAERIAARLDWLYVVTATLLTAHEIDSAYWREWTLFGLPGGIQFFVLANIPLSLLFLYGLVRVAREPKAGAWFAALLSAAGVAAFGIHMWLLWQGHAEFRLPVSVAVLVAALLSSILLGWRSVGVLRSGG